jgi:Methyltransferase domain
MITNAADFKNRINKNPMSCTWQWCIDWMNLTISQLPIGSVVVELGTFVGGTTRQIALANPGVIVHTIDLNNFGDDHKFMVDNFKEFYNCPDLNVSDLPIVQQLHLEDLPNVIQYTGDSKSLSVNNIDVAYIDASHTYEDVLADLEHVYSNLKIGGYIYGDDVDSLWVYYAVYDFAKKYDLEVSIYSKFFKITKIADSLKIDKELNRAKFETSASRPQR